MKKTLKFFIIGDIVGKTGRNVLYDKLDGICDLNRIDLVIANGENAAGGWSITPEITTELLSKGVDVITSGNHIWDNRDVYKIIDSEARLIRPANYPRGVEGNGYYFCTRKGIKICVVNLMGRVMMTDLDCPFRKFDELYNLIKDESDIIIVDFHAEATAEKRALGWYLDGRASLVYGTHTHVQTADEEIQPKGTGYITDIGMTGSFDSVIGMKKEQSIERFLLQKKVRYEVSSGNPGVNGIIAEINCDGKTEAITRINIR